MQTVYYNRELYSKEVTMFIEMKSIHKAFGNNKVLKGVNIDIKEGEIHALMGENGAGKSTLMNILTGIHKANSGEIFVDGKKTEFKNAKEAEQNGISFVHQELNIWPNLTILENLFLDKEIKTKFGFLNKKEMKKIAMQKCEEIGIDLPLNKIAEDCSVGQQQMTEILRTLMINSKFIIMDEPTSALTDRETEKLFAVMKKLRKKKVSIVYISHRMEEVFMLSDRITVMRDGISVSTKNISDTNYDMVVSEMVGRELSDYFPKRTVKLGEEYLRVENLNSKHFKNVSFSVKEGEILGFSGLMGAGRTEIMRCIFGIDPLKSGDIYVKGKKVIIKNPETAKKAGIGFVTEDRKGEGLLLDFSIHQNISLPSIDTFAPKLFIKSNDEKDFTSMLAKRLNVKMSSIKSPVGQLSGGNQQKVVIAKWIGAGPKILILDEPTRGIDVGAKREIYELMNELTDRGVAIIMISSELPEVLGMSDRIVVVHEGKIMGELLKEEATQEKIIRLATGGKLDGKH